MSLWKPFSRQSVLNEVPITLGTKTDLQKRTIEYEVIHEWTINNMLLIKVKLLVCTGVWTVYFMAGLFNGVPPVYVAHTRREANSTEAVSSEMASWISSAISYGAVPWVLVLPLLAHFFGRKVPFFLLSINAIASYSVLYASQTTIHVLISVIMSGMSIAAHTTVNVMIIAEYTSPKYRGVFLTLKSAIVYWGIWVANALGAYSHWRNVGILGLVSCIFLATSIIWPESPYWLASKGKIEECAVSHHWLKGVDIDSEKELELLIKSQTGIKNKGSLVHRGYCGGSKFMDTIRKTEVYRPLLLSFALEALYDCSGKMVYTMYVLEIVKEITQSESTAYTAMLLLDGVTVLAMYIGCAMSFFLKRRVLLLGFGSIGIAFLYIISLYLYLVELTVIDKNNIVLLVLLTGYSLFICVGPMLMITSIYGEIIPLKFAHEASTMVGLFDACFGAVMLKCAPYLFTALGLHGSFLFYGIISTGLVVLLYIYLPETKDNTLQEISDWFKGNRSDLKDCESKSLTETMALTLPQI